MARWVKWSRGLVAAAAMVTTAAVVAPRQADAFCGFYVSGAESGLYNNATQVVLMRDGTRTILSMQNNYQGPLEDFAMVIPVPVILQEENVKTLDKGLFDKIDQLSAPRLVEYWEQDPCNPHTEDEFFAPTADGGVDDDQDGDPGGVNVEAEFKVGEYEIVILSAGEATALETWLTDNNYTIPPGSAQHLAPYVEGGSYFFVARVIAQEVRFEGDQAILSPLRFQYDSETFNLPIRLGLINARDQQDLMVYTLARNQRFEVANYPNATIPTNIDVRDAVREDFGGFYNSLFERTLAQHPGAVITEYSWNAATCDPCPGPTLDPADMATLGADVLGIDPNTRDWVLTRLHARYGAGNVGEDLVFRAASPIAGGREFLTDNGQLEEGAQPSSVNNFQGRYAIRHLWEGPIECAEPQRGLWGGPPGEGGDPRVQPAVSPNSGGAAPRTQDAALEELVAEEVPELGVTPREPSNGINPPTSGELDPETGCASAPGGPGAPMGALLLMGLAWALRTRRRRK